MKTRKRQLAVFDLQPDDGLYAVDMLPLNASDRRHKTLVSIDMTVKENLISGTNIGEDGTATKVSAAKSASKLGTWYSKILWIGKIFSLAGTIEGFEDGLVDFCNRYVSPLSIPPARKSYQISNVEDLADLSIRFFGIGSERLKQTLERSIGLSPMVKIDGKMRHKIPTPVPAHNFPSGRWKTGKTPKVAKNIIHNLHQASIGEVVYMDTYEVDDSSYRYAQAFVEYRSNYGDIVPLRSRSQVGWSFAEFCARNFTPLILIRDNIGENIGGELLKECLHRSVKSAFICPYRKQQNYAEGYIGRVTALASYGMVYSGAPIFMWIWCISCAVFINNITAAFYSAENTWATPYELLHNEPFMDSSIVVPFGCGVLVLLTEAERGKFHSRCALMIFAHYANQHPLYTYAVYSPRTKRLLYRQDCIFLTNLFPMRNVRAQQGMTIEGDVIIPYRSPVSMREGCQADLSFTDWEESHPLPQYQDHITGFRLAPPTKSREASSPKPTDHPFVKPNDSRFGPPSVVKVPYIPTAQTLPQDKIVHAQQQLDPDFDIDENLDQQGEISMDEPVQPGELAETEGPLTVNSKKSRRRKKKTQPTSDAGTFIKRPVGQRYYYETVPPVLEGSISTKAQIAVQQSKDQGQLDTWDGTIAQQEKLDTWNRIDDERKSRAAQVLDECPTSNDAPPPELGSVVPISLDEIEKVGNLEWTAWSLQGALFHDPELEWCRVVGWGMECGIIIIHYSPIDKVGSIGEEHHNSLDNILAVIKQSGTNPVVSEYQPSRMLHPSDSRRRALCYKQLGYTNIYQAPATRYGSCVVHQLGARVGSYNGNLISTPAIKRILRAQETIFKYGTMIPRNDAEADRSPEAARWVSGRTLEWIRLHQAATFETQWTWTKIQQQYPNYLKSDIGHMFFIYDYKFSGEHRVRLVFDGSKQSPATYHITYAPTVRAESVRLFHIYAVEYSWSIQQYDVPQAFLRSKADCDIFAYPPKGFAEFSGQLLKLSKMLYGSKQAAALWYNMLNSFLLEIGFVASPLDPCFYRRPIKLHSASQSIEFSARSDAILILHVDDMRVAAEPLVLESIHNLLFQKFEITISDSGRFLGMDTSYDLVNGVLRMQMTTYIKGTVERFQNFNLAQGVPYRELVGSLMWIVLCIMGPELLRVKDLARRSNHFTPQDYQDALQVLHRIDERKDCGIIYRRGAAGKERIPSSSRLGGDVSQQVPVLVADIGSETYSTGDQTWISEMQENDLYKAILEEEKLDIVSIIPMINPRFTVVAYSDASFAVGELKQSVTGLLVMINGTPLLWASLKQTTVVDSTCSAEYVASSVCCKQILQAENMMHFLDFTCPKPYTLYTDSQACLQIATNSSKLGMVRHVGIRYHLVRCLVLSGEIRLIYCITEDMIADIFTKIVTGSQDKRLATRFYNDCDMLAMELKTEVS
jgi:hypothetical protein